jgi:hypothetical protein
MQLVSMGQVTHNKEVTALLVIDPYNDFISVGGKIWNRIRAVAEANDCIPHMLQILNAARESGLHVFYALHHRYRPGDYETWKYVAPVQKAAWVSNVRRRDVGRRDTRRVRAVAGRHRGPRALVFQRLCQHRLGLAAQEAWDSSAHRHWAHSTNVRGGDRSLCCRARLPSYDGERRDRGLLG